MVCGLGGKEHVVFELSEVPHVDSVGSVPSYGRSGARGKRRSSRCLCCQPGRQGMAGDRRCTPVALNMFDNLTAAQAYLRNASRAPSPGGGPLEGLS